MEPNLEQLEAKVKKAALRSALKAAQPPLLLPSTAADDAVLQAAQQRAKSIRSRRRAAPWIAMAASLAIICGVLFASKQSQTFAADDVNHDGSVDVLDALALAKASHGNLQSAEALVRKTVTLVSEQ
jgi:hypothetical protein